VRIQLRNLLTADAEAVEIAEGRIPDEPVRRSLGAAFDDSPQNRSAVTNDEIAAI
jgi:hypothetical protein